MKLKEIWPLVRYKEPVYVFNDDTCMFVANGEIKRDDLKGQLSDYMDYYVTELEGSYDASDFTCEEGFGVDVFSIGIGITISKEPGGEQE